MRGMGMDDVFDEVEAASPHSTLSAPASMQHNMYYANQEAEIELRLRWNRSCDQVPWRTSSSAIRISKRPRRGSSSSIPESARS